MGISCALGTTYMEMSVKVSKMAVLIAVDRMCKLS